MVKFNATIMKLRESSSGYVLEFIRLYPLFRLRSDEGKCTSITQGGTMLETQLDLLVEPLHRGIKREQVDSTDKDTIIWELIVSTEAGLDTKCHWPSLFTDGTSWNVNLEPMTLPVVVQWLVWRDLYLCLSYDICSLDYGNCNTVETKICLPIALAISWLATHIF